MVLTTPGNVLDVGTTRKHPGIHETEGTDSSGRSQQGWHWEIADEFTKQ